MTLKELKKRTRFMPMQARGSYRIVIEFRGREYACVSQNTLAVDRIKAADCLPPVTPDDYFTTEKKAYESLYIECKLKHNL
ncbi:TPA_asm: hypothetical protein [Porphyromonas phage phage017a_JCVISC001]|uniref:Uncharacterized protein n=1 Tax=Porphyromonas phage phage017a_JCVISC001 TaxID=3154107 RepID=A0AAT9J8G9_9CAUD|nr:hypothetical protein A343_1858 [Porphyromonas gingivalis JCVI SC001]